MTQTPPYRGLAIFSGIAVLSDQDGKDYGRRLVDLCYLGGSLQLGFTLTMSVTEKRSDIAILQVLG